MIRQKVLLESCWMNTLTSVLKQSGRAILNYHCNQQNEFKFNFGIGENLGRSHPNSIAVGLFLESLNEMIDVHSKRILVSLPQSLASSTLVCLVSGNLFHDAWGGVSRRPRQIPTVAVNLDHGLEFLHRA
jgi:hypothetical protein